MGRPRLIPSRVPTVFGDFDPMRITSIACFAASILLLVFGAWGIFSTSGQHAFDEMAGIVPFAAVLLSPILAIVALIAWWLPRRAERIEG